MVPSALVLLDSLPLSANGKLDHKRLPQPDMSGLSAQHYQEPQTPVERILADIWRELLSVKRVGRHDNFFELGGDSILSIQVVSRARQAGVVITPKQLFQNPTLSALAAAAGQIQQLSAEQGVVSGDVPLTPIQHWFFEQNLNNPHHWNQALFLKVSPGLNPDIVEAALKQLLNHHDALRMRFSRGDNGWQQTNLAEESHRVLERIDLSSVSVDQQTERIQAEASIRQAALHLTTGPLLRAAWFDLGVERDNRVLIAIHHLVVDGVSWRILLEDLNSVCLQLMVGQTLSLPAKTTSFKHWAERMQQLANTNNLAVDVAYWLNPSRNTVPTLPVDEAAGGNRIGLEDEIVVSLSAQETRALLQEVPAAYRTRIDEVLLTALALTLRDWTQAATLLIDVEGHGREDLAADLDVSRTVGWFSNVYPLLLNLTDGCSPGDALKAAKEQLRAVPMKGIAYGWLRYLSADETLKAQLAAQSQAQIIFNYLGQFDTVVAAGEPFEPSSEPAGISYDPTGKRNYELDIIGSISDGCLRVSWRYSRERYRYTTLETLAGRYLQQLKDLIAHCTQADAGGYTPSDFPLQALSQTELESMDLKPRQIEDIYPLAPLQHGLIFHSLYAPESSVYCIQLACRLRGELNVAAFQQAWQQLLERHPVLRTRFYFKDLEQPLQIIDKHVQLPIKKYDWRGMSADQQQQSWQQLLGDDHAKGFDFSRAPLMRLTLAQCSNDMHYFLWSYHHVLLDGWSTPLLIKDVFTAYQALQRGDMPFLPTVKPYSGYIAWLQHQDMAAAEAYWQAALIGFTEPVALSTGQAPSGFSKPTGSGKQTLLLFEAETSTLQHFVKRQQLTLNTLAQAAWGLLLSRYSGNDDVVFGITVSGRPAELIGVEEMVGLFINSLPMRMQLRPESRVTDWLQALFDQNQDMRRYEYASLAKIQSWSEISPGQNLFDTLLVFENYPIDQALTEVGGPIRIDEVGGIDPNNYPLTLSIFPGSRLRLEISHDTDSFSVETVDAMLAHLRQLLIAFVERPESRLCELPALTQEEQQQILHDWNATAVDYPKDRCIHQLFEAQVEKTPDAVALRFEKQQLSYDELNAKANQLAHYLCSRGVGPEVLVGICLERSLEMVIGLLGILKAGGAYVPLDPGYPQDRLDFMLHDVSASIVLTQETCREKIAASTATLLCLDSEWDKVASADDANPDIPLRPENLAYCIYTSGSTGQPKGAGVPHQGILNRLQWMQQQYGLDRTDRILQKTPYSFDVSVWEFFWPLMTGARLVVAEPDQHKDSPALVDIIRREGITTIHFVPSMLHAFIETPGVENCTSLKRVICSGEALSADLVTRFQQKLPAELHNLYGPTEASVDVSYWTCLPSCIETAIPIGRPIANIGLYILDRHLNPVPVGTPGELHIAGIGLGRCYLNRPDLTADKFIPNPFGPAGDRLYKTGDLVRYRFDGNIDYLGRIDHQVKIRGFRIELGEIEAQLLAHPGVKEAVVLAREDQPNDKRLVAYLVENQTGTIPIDNLRTRLKDALPDYMVPSAFVVLDEMPLSANGKLDRKCLPVPGISEQRGKHYVAPGTQTETILSEIWQEVLGVEQVGAEDNFFDLGGHSLLATQLFFLVQKRLAAKVAFNAFLTDPTVAAQARLIDGGAGQTIDFDAEAVLDPAIVPLAADAIDIEAARTIFLTGATGFLGVFLLADLLEHSQADIYCLVRARDERQALLRLQQQIGLYELTERVDFSRIIAVCGDLAEPNFGLSESRYREIAERGEAIYHNGALVNFVQPYQTLKAANVSGTEEVLRLACRGRAKAIHYVSTVSVFSEAPRHATGHKEIDEPEQRGNLPNGYAQSKWVAEKLMVAARGRGFQVSIYRLAIVAGDSRSGAWNTGDFWCRLIKGCLQMGYAPCERIRMDMAPVDYMSRSIVALSQRADAVGGIFHLNHPEPPYSDDWLDFFASLGYRLQRIPYRDWLEKVLEFGRSNPDDFALASLLPMFAEQIHDGNTQLPEDETPQYDSLATHKALSALNVECALLDRDIMARYQGYFVRSGFVADPDGEGLDGLKIIFDCTGENVGGNRLPAGNIEKCLFL
ncbi:non-ribosomal peptide synthetase [Methylobacter sp.]|uniref:non-ribosomal peptide synthetase n=1 Tax=Methylobacter sp. TaxID=2051955 RepID=UPI0025F980D3|nr:non-ribosomal peptide synthetase [Methylobacter sp.]